MLIKRSSAGRELRRAFCCLSRLHPQGFYQAARQKPAITRQLQNLVGSSALIIAEGEDPVICPILGVITRKEQSLIVDIAQEKGMILGYGPT